MKATGLKSKHRGQRGYFIGCTWLRGRSDYIHWQFNLPVTCRRCAAHRYELHIFISRFHKISLIPGERRQSAGYLMAISLLLRQIYWIVGHKIVFAKQTSVRNVDSRQIPTSCKSIITYLFQPHWHGNACQSGTI